MSHNTYHPGEIPREKPVQLGLADDGVVESGGHHDQHDGEIHPTGPATVNDVFGSEEGHDIKYKTLHWPMVAVLMITEIISNGMLSLPSSLAAVGIVPGIVVILFLGCFATYTAWALIQFKLRHPQVHNMGDAGQVMFGPIGREILGGGTIIFAVCGTGSQMLAGQLALSELSDHRLCAVAFTGIFAAAITLFSFPRTLDQLAWLSILAAASIIVAGIVAMTGAGAVPVAPGDIAVAVATDFTSAFVSITNPVFAYAGHFMFFILISEMRRPEDAMKAAWTLQVVATAFYIVFAGVTYWYVGSGVASPSLLSLSPLWSKISFGLAVPNFFLAGSLYSHTAAKLVFVRLFRHGRHLHSHTWTGWSVWTFLVLLANVAAFVLAVGIPVFNYLVGITAALFAAWYTYGLAGAFWLHDAYHFGGGLRAWTRRPAMLVLNALTVVAGAFICFGGLYATIKAMQAASAEGSLPRPFQC
ncbi:transmembrane amino acid transporter [Apiospora hydei]|uniref:Transmembrane amino acid transporter n=1 Tax=Apiospora hydei TaxID=1337664 RepID=A0ABR1UWG0_9PEZI